MTTKTPLRYPGGKSRLTNFIKMVMDKNKLVGGEYAEVYAGGAGVAVNLLSCGYASRVHINDVNPFIFSFWKCVFEQSDKLCELIWNTPVTMETWHAQKVVFENAKGRSSLELAFAAFFLNRTNRSGILSGGVIGGKDQTGKWKIDARYNKENLCLKIETISGFSDRVSIYQLDAEVFLSKVASKLPPESLIFLDPPYFVKSERLYQNLYSAKDHARLAKKVRRLRRPWLISYDDVAEIRTLYYGLRRISYGIQYSAADRSFGDEVIFVQPRMKIGSIKDPLAVA